MEILSKEQILLNDQLSSKNEILQLIAKKAATLGLVSSCEELMESFMEREALGMTGIGEGIAIPHGKSSAINRVSVMVVKSAIPIQWESFDNNPVYVVIALMVPKENPDNIHLQILSSISRKLMDKDFKKSLFGSSTPDEIMELFKEFSIK